MSSAHEEEIANYAVEKAISSGASYAEAYLLEEHTQSYALEQGMLNGGLSAETKGIRLRLIKSGSLFTISTNIITKSSVNEMLRRPKPFNGKTTGLSDEKTVNESYEVKERKKFADANPTEDLVEYDRELSKDKGVKYRSMYVSYGTSSTYFVNSEGSTVKSKVPSLSSFFNIIIGNGTETRQRFLQYGGVGGYETFDIGKIRNSIKEETKHMLEILEKGVSLSKYERSKVKNIVVSPEISGIAAHESIGHPNEADRVFGREAAQAGTSYLNPENLGMRIGSEAVNIIDDPTIKGSYGFYLYDDEGVKARPKLIIKSGMQNELLINREYAMELGTNSNASSRSSDYSVEPIVRMSNTYLKPGSAKFSELLSEAREGIYIKSFTEWNIDDTRSFAKYQGNEAYTIEKGGIGKPVKNFSLEISTFDFWKSVRLVDNEFKLYLGTCGKGEPMQGVPVTMGGAAALLSIGE